jgi:hypothetical protein
MLRLAAGQRAKLKGKGRGMCRPFGHPTPNLRAALSPKTTVALCCGFRAQILGNAFSDTSR